MHQPDDSNRVDLNRPRQFKSLASLTGWENEIAFRIQCKQILKDSGTAGLLKGMETIHACFQAALEVYQEEIAREIAAKFKNSGDASNEVK